MTKLMTWLRWFLFSDETEADYNRIERLGYGESKNWRDR